MTHHDWRTQMAEKTTITYTCDAAGHLAGSTDHGDIEPGTRIGLDGRDYEVDLCTRHAVELRARLLRYVLAARKARKTPQRRRSDAERRHSAEVRAWAKAHGWSDISDRGRTPAAAVQAYNEAHPR